MQMALTWFSQSFGDLARQLRWSFLPPLMIYFAAGVAGLTSIVGTFFVKDYLDLSAAFLASLAFWTGLPWVLKMPVGHIVDLIWRRKDLLVWIGASLIAVALLIMYGLVTRTQEMAAIMPVSAWYVLASLLSPVGYVIQDVVADAMTVEAVPEVGPDGTPIPPDESKAAHTTMQMLGRFSIISGLVAVALLNIVMFSGVESLDASARAGIYGQIYLIALAIPALSVSGVLLHRVILKRRVTAMREQGLSEAEIGRLLFRAGETTVPNWQILGGGLAFALASVGIGLSGISSSEEIVFAISMAIVLYLISQLIRELDPAQARALIGTAVIIFVFRAIPSPGPGQSWFEIDILGFDEQFLSVLSLITSCLTLVGLVVLRPLMANRTIAYIVVLLTLASALLSLPNIGLYYGLHEWTAAMTGGVVDARFIAVLDTAIESPLGQIAMVPMLAWIARNAPDHLKATFFAVMASFTNLALSASSLGTKYLNQIFLVEREVRDRVSGALETPADYSELGLLLITGMVLGLVLPLLTVWVVQRSRFRTSE